MQKPIIASGDSDPEIKSLALEERVTLITTVQDLERQVQLMLLPWMKPTLKTPFLKFAPVQAAKKRRTPPLRACISVTPSTAAGSLSYWT